MLIEFTEEEQQRLKEIQDSFSPEWERLTALINGSFDNKEERRNLFIQRQAVYDSMIEELDAYNDLCQRKRFNQKFNELTPVSVIISDAKQQAPTLLEYIHRETVREFEGLNGEELEAIGIGTYKKGKLYVYAEYATKWLKEELRLHIEAVKADKDNLQTLLAAIIEAVEVSPYTCGTDTKAGAAGQPDPQALAFKHKPLSITPDSAIFKANMPMYHGKATDALAALSHRDITENPLTNKAVIQTKAGDYKIVIQDFNKVKGKLSVNTHKLLSTGIAEFTQINNYGPGNINPKVTIPFDEYARRLGYEIDERETDSPEAAAKEKKRAQEAYKTAKKRIRQDLDLLQAMKWTWQEKLKGKGADFDSIILLERVAIRNGYIIMEFGRNMAEYLKQLPLTQYPQGLLAIDARSENAYKLGLKMAEHYNIDNNQIKGTANRLKVSTLLTVTNLPTIEDLQNETPDDSRHWDRRIKTPFEVALDTLTGKVIKDWEYVKTKGEPLTEDEAYNITDYEAFTNLLLQFELLEAPDHKERLSRRADDKKRAATKKAAKDKAAKQKGTK